MLKMILNQKYVLIRGKGQVVKAIQEKAKRSIVYILLQTQIGKARQFVGISRLN